MAVATIDCPPNALRVASAVTLSSAESRNVIRLALFVPGVGNLATRRIRSPQDSLR